MTFCIGARASVDLQKSDWLPIYDEEGIRQTLTEVLDLIGKMEAVISRRESLPARVKTLRRRRWLNWCIIRSAIAVIYATFLTYFCTTKKMKLRWETGIATRGFAAGNVVQARAALFQRVQRRTDDVQ